MTFSTTKLLPRTPQLHSDLNYISSLVLAESVYGICVLL